MDPSSAPPRKSSTSNPTPTSSVNLKIPSRTTSNKHALDDLSFQYASLTSSIELKKQKLKHVDSFDSVYWTSPGDLVEEEIQWAEVDREWRRIDWIERGGDEETWEEELENLKLKARTRILISKLPRMREQAFRFDLADKDQEGFSLRSYATLFNTSVSGLGITTRQSKRKRDNSEQHNFRQTLLDENGLKNLMSKHPSHLVPYRFGSDIFTSIFGTEVKNEMFSAKNGLLLNNTLVEQFESGLFAIVPDLPNDCSPAERKDWRANPVNDYKIRFIDKPNKDWVPGLKLSQADRHPYNRPFDSELKWKDLDGKKLEFRNNQRPRARYLYFTFCLNMLRLTWKDGNRAKDILAPELGKFYWGSPRRYVRGTLLRGFVQEIGHKYEEVFEDKEGEEDIPVREYTEGSEDLLLEAATSSVLIRTSRNEDEEQEEEDPTGMEESESFRKRRPSFL